MKVLTVSLGSRSYPIEIGSGLLEKVGTKLKGIVKGRQVALVTDNNVSALYGATVIDSLQAAGFAVCSIVIPAGEGSKSWKNAEQILATLLQEKFHRDGSILALGGGVVGDLAGFVASIYQRGVNFIQIPTSLLAQVDSSVGGKVAVNHPLGKNMIGAFYQPLAVWVDLDSLQTLDERQWQNGLAEVIKYGMLTDHGFFQFLEDHTEAINRRNAAVVAEMIAACCQLKAQIVALDETEQGVRAKLNFGHTIGHGLEMATHYTGYLHGEAVAIGMVLEAAYASGQGMCTEDVLVQLKTLLRAYHLPVNLDTQVDIDAVLTAMALDKKVVDDQWVLILPEAIGTVQIVQGVSPEAIRHILESQVIK